MYISYDMNTSIIWLHDTPIYFYISLYMYMFYISCICMVYISYMCACVCVLYISYILLYVIYISLYNGIILVYKGILLVYKYIILAYMWICFWYAGSIHIISLFTWVYIFYIVLYLFIYIKKNYLLSGSLSILYMYIITIISELCYLFNAMYKSLCVIYN